MLGPRLPRLSYANRKEPTATKPMLLPFTKGTLSSLILKTYTLAKKVRSLTISGLAF